MNSARLKAVGKLLLVLGVPIACVLALFGSGVWCGVQNRYEITSFEHDVLGLDVEVPPAPATPAPTPPPAASPDADAKPATPTPEPVTEPVPVVERPAPTPTPPPTTTTTTVEEPAAKVDPLGDDLAARLKLPVKVRVKVLVDDDLAREHEDWIDYVQRTTSRASRVYQDQFGIELELTAVGRWPVAAKGMRVDALLDDLRDRDREGADILLGMTARALDDGVISGQAETPSDTSPWNGAHGIVYAVPGMSEPHLRTLLHEIGHLFGALDITDPSDPSWRAGSWMSYAPA
ncbi:MAG TPA: M12 family metallo-peptidase, partial [Nannocystaceae bacterium]|nr:M12 family metallo-peptidase [Nannocystaceae bacterium]